MMNETVTERKGWFLLVMQARENMRGDMTDDEFTDPKCKSRAWVGL